MAIHFEYGSAFYINVETNIITTQLIEGSNNLCIFCIVLFDHILTIEKYRNRAFQLQPF